MRRLLFLALFFTTNLPAPRQAAMSDRARVVLPEPESPRIRTPRSPRMSAVAWRLADLDPFGISENRAPGQQALAYASAGKAMVNRAPRISPGLVPGMFSALSQPPCASAICLLMESPRPEFWPNASGDGRSV